MPPVLVEEYIAPVAELEVALESAIDEKSTPIPGYHTHDPRDILPDDGVDREAGGMVYTSADSLFSRR